MTLRFVDGLGADAYITLRNNFIKEYENEKLFTGQVADVGVESDGKNLFIGYGFDLVVHSAAQTKAALESVGVALNGKQKSALDAYKAGGSEAEFISAWTGVRLSEAAATLLLNTEVQKFETSLTNKLGLDDLPQSAERAALISQTYNLGTDGIPQEIRILREIPTTDADAFLQRARVFHEIAYSSTSLDNPESTWRGLELRRLAEAATFGLYSGNTLQDSPNGDEAKAVFAFMDGKDLNNALEGYLTTRKFNPGVAKQTVDAQFAPAVDYLSNKFGDGHIFTDRHAVFVDKPGAILAMLPQDRAKLDNLIFAEDGNDVVDAGKGSDVVYGGAGLDKLSGGGANDTLKGGEDDDQLRGGAGNDLLEGGQGVNDVAIFAGPCPDYEVRWDEAASVWKVTHLRGGPDGVDTLSGVEFVQFGDRVSQLQIGRSICPSDGQDLTFVIDTTGSMSDDIDQVKVAARNLIGQIFDDPVGGANSRVAVVGFKDPGETSPILTFTDQASATERRDAALAAIGGISVGGGGDTPEGVYSGLLTALSGAIGTWREDVNTRRIVLFGDAPPKDTELREQVEALARDVLSDGAVVTDVSGSGQGGLRTLSISTSEAGVVVNRTVEIYTVLVGGDTSAATGFQDIADSNNGLNLHADTATEVVAALEEAITSPYLLSIEGTEDADTLEGTLASDRILGFQNDDELNGGQGDDRLVGGAGLDTLDGEIGDDGLDGGDGADTLAGGAGDDLYYVDNVADAVIESDGLGRDTVRAVIDYTLTENVEALELSGAASAGRGNGLDNLITGNVRDNKLDGGAGDDRLLGGDGADILRGETTAGLISNPSGSGNASAATAMTLNGFSKAFDPFILNSTTDAHVTVESAGDGTFKYFALDILSANDRATLDIDGANFDSYIRLFDGAGTMLSYNDDASISLGELGSTSSHDSFLTFTFPTAGRFYLEVAQYSRNPIASGSVFTLHVSLSNVGVGSADRSAGDDVLNGGAGGDYLIGGNGFDTASYAGASAQVTIDLLAGAYSGDALGDVFRSIEAFELTEFDDIFAGDGGPNQAAGGDGDDSLAGGGGADTLKGGAGADSLDGGRGADVLSGGAGDDVYLDPFGDVVFETSEGGVDLIYSSAAIDLASFDNVENLILTGKQGISGGGNDLGNMIVGNVAGNALSGAAGADLLKGAGGDDLLRGGLGDDTLNGGRGVDVADYRYSLAAISVALRGGSDAFVKIAGDREDVLRDIENIFGGRGDDSISGDARDNLIAGGSGADTLWGRGGSDTFLFNTWLVANNVDHIKDFSLSDKISLDNEVFNAAGLDVGALAEAAFYSASGALQAHDLNDRIIYNSATGALYYDADGAEGASAVQFAVLDNRAGVGAENFVVV